MKINLVVTALSISFLLALSGVSYASSPKWVAKACGTNIQQEKTVCAVEKGNNKRDTEESALSDCSRQASLWQGDDCHTVYIEENK